MADRKNRITLGRSILLVTLKNLKIYAGKPPVLIFGVLFPAFFFLAFYLGRRVEFHSFFPRLLAMSLFFLSTSIGPLITPWEKTTRTYERLLAFPVTIRSIILGDILTGMIYGLILCALVLTAGLIFLAYRVQILLLAGGLVVGAFCFASLGTMLSSPPVPNASYIMMLSSLIRFPLIFISGIFVPLVALRGAARILSYISPLTYLVDIVGFALKGEFALNPLLDFLALVAFGVAFCIAAHKMHRRNMIRGL